MEPPTHLRLANLLACPLRPVGPWVRQIAKISIIMSRLRRRPRQSARACSPRLACEIASTPTIAVTTLDGAIEHITVAILIKFMLLENPYGSSINMLLSERFASFNHEGFWKNFSKVCLLLASGILAHYFYVGIFCSDDSRYIVGMAKILGGEPILVHSPAERRLFFLLPGALFMWLGGDVDWAVLSYLSFYLLLPQVSWLLAERFVDWRRAAWAGFITAFIPLAYTNAGTILPDIMSGVFLGLSLLNLVAWHQTQENGLGCNRASARLLMSGAFLALAVLVKESSLVMLPIPAFYFLAIALRERLRISALVRPLPFLLGLTIVFVIDAVAFRVFADTWHSSLLNASSPHDFREFIAEQGIHPFERFAYLMGLLSGEAWFFVSAAVASILVSMSAYRFTSGLRDSTGALLVVAYFILPLLYFTVGTSSLSEYIPPVMQARYYLPLIVPGSVLMVLGYSWVARALDRHAWRPLNLRKGLVLASGAFVVINAGLGMKLVLPERGVAYAAQAKETYLIAMSDLEARFPQLPIVDTSTGWTTDLPLCRAILKLSADAEHAAELRAAEVHEPLLEDLSPPFLLVGVGDYLEESGQSVLVDSIRNGLAAGQLHQVPVGDYFSDSADDAGPWLFSRQTTVQRAALQSPEEFTISSSNGDPRADSFGLRAYLITQGRK